MGERIGRFQLVKPLGHGGMAEVFLARQDGVAGFSKELVIKRVLPDLVNDRKFVEMFLDEARLAALLTHPNICQVFELGEADGQYFIAMEKIAGRTLTELIRTAREKKLAMPLPAALRIVAQLCEALGYAHALKDDRGQPVNLVHRDVTPSNVMVTPDASVKLLDFGIARAATRSTRTQVGVTKGKMGFMAPEQVTAPQSLDLRADLFAVGALLYLLTVGRAPYADVPRGDLLREMGLGRFPRPRAVNPALPEELEAITLKAMAAERGARYSSALEFHRAIEKAAMSLGLSLGPHALRDFLLDLDRDASTQTTLPTLKPVGARVGSSSGADRADEREDSKSPPAAPRERAAEAPPSVNRDAATRLAGRHEVAKGAPRDEATLEAEVGPKKSRASAPTSAAGVMDVRTADLVPNSEVTKRRRGPLVASLAVTLVVVAGGGAWVVRRGAAAADPAASSRPRAPRVAVAPGVPATGASASSERAPPPPGQPTPSGQPASAGQPAPPGQPTPTPPAQPTPPGQPPPPGQTTPPGQPPSPGQPTLPGQPTPPGQPPSPGQPPPSEAAPSAPIPTRPTEPTPTPAEVAPRPPPPAPAPRPPVVAVAKPKPAVKPAPAPAAPLDLSGPVGTLRVTATPAAKVSVAGHALGTTPLTTRLPVGSHRLRIEYPGGGTHQLLINVVEGKETVVRDAAD